jgi:hypothetical protein
MAKLVPGVRSGQSAANPGNTVSRPTKGSTAAGSKLVSKPVIGIAVLAVVAYIAVIYMTPPQSATSTRHATANTSTATDPNGITQADLDAHFARYKLVQRDPFVPGVINSHDQPGTDAGIGGGQGQWALTGIDEVNGVISGLVENSATGESVFLTPGQRWRGLKVVSVGSDSIVFENALGQHTDLAFAITAPASQTGPAAPAAPGAPGPPGTPAVAGSSSLPSLGAIRPLPRVGSLPPLPVPPPARSTASQESRNQP